MAGAIRKRVLREAISGFPVPLSGTADPEGLKILDIACGSGFGSALLADRAEIVVGSTTLRSMSRRPGNATPKLRAYVSSPATANSSCMKEVPAVRLAVSLHTLEHVPDDQAMLASLRRNLRPAGA
jgi:2-polyprenyl-3-methyl-5-hydroxy-6-metoxy-1,4-benzoquinol methylase